MSSKTQVHVYLKNDTVEELIRTKEKTGRPYGEIVDEALNMYFDIPVRAKAQEMLKPASERIDILENKVNYLITAANAQYRILAYIAYLLSGGIPLVKINGNYSLKPYGGIVTNARKKALKNYSQLRGRQLPEEEFFVETSELIDEPIEPVTEEISDEDDIYPFN